MKSLLRLLVCTSALLSGSVLWAVTNVTLNASATPSTADPAVTNVTVIGHGFPSGTIPPANVTVTLNPTTAGAGPSGTTTAEAVTVESGTTEAVTFKVPTSIAVSAATSYQVSIAGTTSTGNAFASRNTASLTVNAHVAITTSSPLPTGTVNVNYSQALTATGGSGTYTWAVAGGTLPAGLSLDTTTGVIGGLPTTKGLSHFEIKVTDSLHSSAGKEFALTIDPALTITTVSPLPTGTRGVNYSQTLTARGGSGTYTWSVSAGALPGLSLNPATGAITGQPSPAGPASFTIQVTDSTQATATKAFTMTVNPALVITTSSPLPQGTVGVNYSQSVMATGGSGTYTWAVTVGSLPNPLALNPTTGLISGQPSTATMANFTIQATDTNGVTATKGFALTINPAIVITTTSPLPQGTVGVNYSQTVAATGGSGTYTWAVTVGSLPSPLALNPTTGLISGQPSAATTANFTIQVTDSNQATATKAFALTINPALVITTSSPLPQGTVGVNYSQTVTATGGSGTYTWAVTVGSLPNPLALNPATGLIGGQPSAATTANFTIQVTDTNQVTATKAFALTVNPALVITTSSPLPTGTVGVNYSQTLAATGGSGSYTWAVSVGSLPNPLLLNPATGLIGGQPGTATTANFTIQVTDTNQVVVTKAFALTINPALLITTTSPLPAATPTVAYSQTFAASGGAGGYSWSATGLPAWLAMSTAGALTGMPPLTAVDSTFTVTVTDSLNVATSGSFTVPVTLAITTTSPLPTGQVGVNYSQNLTATGGTGQYTWSVTTGTLPNPLALNPTTGLISGQPSAATTANFTIQVQDSNQVTASVPFTLTINPAASIQTLSPNSSNAGLSLQVSITGSYTHFAQGTTVASFGPGIAVGGGTAGQPGPVTVISATSATAQIAISASAATGSQTVTVTTGAEQASLTNGLTIQAAIPYISVTTTSTTPLAPGFSGFNDAYPLNGIEYWDPKWVAAVTPLKPGWLRFPGGTVSTGFDWETAHMNPTWLSALQPNIPSNLYNAMVLAESLTQAKGGACFSGGGCVSDYATFLKTLGANGIVSFNGFSDNNPNSAGEMVTTAQTAGLNIVEWEIANEPYVFPKIFPTPASYAAAAYNPYYLNINAANPSAIAGVFFQGQFIQLFGNYLTWDSGMAAYSPQYWQGVTYHVYPIDNSSMATSDEEQTLNGILAHGTTEWYTSSVQPLVGENTPVFLSEVNTDGFATMPFESYIYNGIFLAEYVARMSTVSQVKAVGISSLFLSNSFNQGMIRAVNDFQSYLVAEVKKNPNYVTDTSTNPNTQYQFYYSTNALALEIANLAINSSNATWPTTVTGGPTVPIEGYDGNPVPAVFAQGYQGTDGTHYVLITNKSSSSVPIAIEVDGDVLQSTLTVSYISNASDTAQNTATAQTNVQIVNTTSPNPITVGPYSVTRVQW
jgi:hypothetical protein